MANKYWVNFYKKEHTIEPTAFVIDSVDIIKSNVSKSRVKIIDIMAGNGRDTSYLKQINGFDCVAVDGAFESDIVKRESLDETLSNKCIYDVVYTRFGLHCIEDSEIERLISWTRNFFVAEFRIKGDKALLFPDQEGHTRNYVDLGKLVNFLLREDFEIKSLVAGRGLAKYKAEDPLIARLYAKNKKNG